MEYKIFRSKNGIQIQYDGKTILLDPKRQADADLIFISHAHLDHMHVPSINSNILSSKETAFLALKRGYNLGNIQKESNSFKMFDSGHILGSRSLLIDNEIFYTGDFSLRSRGFLNKGVAVKCHTLIIETTFGNKDYIFPTTAEILEHTNRLISDLFSRGIPIVLMGYPLGKAQTITHFFSSWDPIYFHDSVAKMNQAHIDLGIDIQNNFQLFNEAKKDGLLEKKPWILIAPMHTSRTSFIQELREKYGAKTVAFSGWGVKNGYKYSRNVDYSIPLSDHCDYSDLIKLVKQCSPEKIYTVHGFADEFAVDLQKEGYDATPLNLQKSLDYYIKN